MALGGVTFEGVVAILPFDLRAGDSALTVALADRIINSLFSDCKFHVEKAGSKGPTFPSCHA